MHRAVNASMGIDGGQRRELTAEEIERVLPRLDDLADQGRSGPEGTAGQVSALRSILLRLECGRPGRAIRGRLRG
jgi:hypothetical protein